MNRTCVLHLAAVIGLAIGTCLQPVGDALAADLAVGDAAPDFSLAGTDGNKYVLRDLIGKQAVVIAWFPKAFTPG